MADLATLGIAVDSSQVRTAGRDLQQFQRTGAQTERGAKSLTAANRNLSQSFRNAAGSVAVMHGPLGGIASRLSAVGMLVGRMGLAMGGLAIGVGGATFAAQAGVRAWADYERQLLTTEQVIRATGGAAGRTVEDITALSREIGVATLASGQQVREAGNMLLTFRSIAGETFDETLRLAQDLAAVGFGSVTSATQQLARALEDPAQGLTRLRRVGISFSAAQISVIKNLHETGRVAEAQRAILAQIERQVGGAGAAAGGGLAGAFDNLTEATADWFILVGQNMSDLLRLPGIFNNIANGVHAANEAMRSGGMSGFLSQARQRIEEIEAQEALARRGQQSSGTLGHLELLRREKEAIQANIDEVERFNRAVQQGTDLQSRRAQEEQRTGAFDAVVAGLEDEREALRQTDLQKEIDAALSKAQTTADTERGKKIAELVTLNFREAEAIKAATEAREASASEWESGRAALADLIRAEETELMILRETDPVLKEMIANRDALAFAMGSEEARLQTLIAQRIREQEETDRALAQRQFFEQTTLRALDDLIVRGGSFADVMANVAQQIASAALQASILGTGPLAGLFGSSGSRGLFGTLVGAFSSGPTNIVPASVAHTGGVMGSTAFPSRMMPAGMFDNAPRLHNGLAPDEFPAILQRGERVTPRGGSTPQNMNITLGVEVDESGNLRPFVSRVASEEASVTVNQFSRKALPDRIQEINKHPRNRG